MPIPEPLRGFVLEDDILAPKGAEVIEYYGPNPFAIYPRLSGLLQVIFHARGQHIFEKQFRWDITSDPRPFFVLMHLDRGMDNFTRLFVHLRVFGAQPTDPSKDGKLFVEISGRILTQFPARSVWQRIIVWPFIWLYHRLIYNDVRRRYIQIGKEGVERLQKEIRSILDLVQRERLT